MNPIIFAATVATALGTIGGAAVFLDHAHVASEDFAQHLSEQRVRTVFGYMDQIREQGPQPWLCRAMEEEFLGLCTELPDHAMCDDRHDIMIDVGCNAPPEPGEIQ